MDMPPVSLISYSDKSHSEFYYPKPLVQLWKECTEVKSAKASSPGHFIICNSVLIFLT
jgi:cohesin complex subunit SCC1